MSMKISGQGCVHVTAATTFLIIIIQPNKTNNSKVLVMFLLQTNNSTHVYMDFRTNAHGVSKMQHGFSSMVLVSCSHSKQLTAWYYQHQFHVYGSSTLNTFQTQNTQCHGLNERQATSTNNHVNITHVKIWTRKFCKTAV